MPMRFRTLLRNVSLRATIAGLVVFSVLCAVAALAAGIYISVGTSFMQQGRDQALAALRTAATVFVESADGYTIKWSDDGQLGRITVWGLLPYRDNTLVQAISRVSGAETSIFTLDKDTQALIVGTTTLLGADQHPALGATLDQTGAAYAALSNGALYTTEENLDGNRYFTAYKEIVRDRDAVIVGVLRVAVPLAEVEQRLFDIMGLVLKVCVAVVWLLPALAMSPPCSSRVQSPGSSRPCVNSSPATTRRRFPIPAVAAKSARWRTRLRSSVRTGSRSRR